MCGHTCRRAERAGLAIARMASHCPCHPPTHDNSCNNARRAHDLRARPKQLRADNATTLESFRDRCSRCSRSSLRNEISTSDEAVTAHADCKISQARRVTCVKRKAGGLSIINFRVSTTLPDCIQNQTAVSDVQHLLSDF